MEYAVFNESAPCEPFKLQLLKWIGNKQRFAHEIAAAFPPGFGRYIEPFLGSGAVLGTLAPHRALASDVSGPLIGIWQTLKDSPDTLKQWYAHRWQSMEAGDKKKQYEKIKASYNARPNAADLLFICRSCYGGVVRFRKADGHISTPCGPHKPISPKAFAGRVDIWHARVQGANFRCMDYKRALAEARRGDLVYCDPPYTHSQTILYGAQDFDIDELMDAVRDCKKRGVYVALSIDGRKKSGAEVCDLPHRPGLFNREIFVNCGKSMLKRFQMNGRTLENEVVADRLLLTY